MTDLWKAIRGKGILLGPYEPIEGFTVGIINNNGVPIELIEAILAPEEVWAKAKSGQEATIPR